MCKNIFMGSINDETFKFVVRDDDTIAVATETTMSPTRDEEG